MLYKCAKYIFCNKKLKSFEANVAGFNSPFPHHFSKKLSKQYYKNLTISPFSGEMLLDFAKNLIINDKLRQQNQPDFLLISLSATDAIGHQFGPNSVESKDNFIRLNANLDSFLSFIDEKVGLNNVLIVLSAEHGVSPSPTYLKQFKFPAGEINPNDFENAPSVITFLKKYHLNWQKLVTHNFPELYLNQQYLEKRRLDKQKK